MSPAPFLHPETTMAWHRFLDHTSEITLHVGAADWPGLLAQAGLGLAELLLRGTAPAASDADTAWRPLEVSSHDRESLLVDWLNEIVYVAETGLWVPLEIEIDDVSETHLKARARGVAVEAPPSLVKAATFHDLHVRDLPEGLDAEVILDV
ncbi:MAG TPA: archease [Thermoanaerobaculia bacterium]|nr:archease [Thermoanaerobaculia bacterium]